MNTIERFGEPAPVRPYDPNTRALGIKIERHIRKKGWKKSIKIITGSQWKDPKDGSYHTFLGAIRVQLNREGFSDVQE